MGLRNDLIVILAKIEATYGIDPAPTGALNAILGFNPKLNPMAGQDAERNRSLPYFSGKQKFPTNLYQELSFETELVGNSALGVLPGWDPLMKASGFAAVVNAGVSVVYNPISVAIASATLYFYQDGQRHTLRGARGSAQIKYAAHGLPMVMWRFIGLYDPPSNVANAVPTLTNFQDPQVVNKAQTPTFTINGYAAAMRSLSLDFGTKLVYRELVGQASVEITDREPMVQTQIEAVSLATFNPYVTAQNQTAFAINLVHGVGAGKVSTLSLPNCRLQRPESFAEQDKIVEWPLSITSLPVIGNDEFTLTFT
jgi:hypothetical protein